MQGVLLVASAVMECKEQLLLEISKYCDTASEEKLQKIVSL